MLAFKDSIDFALKMDAEDDLKIFRNQFFIPQHNGKDVIYFCGNSLGLQPKSAKNVVDKVLNDWEKLGVEGHFKGDSPWVSYHKQFREPISQLVGALSHEVVVMNNLSTNLHLLLVSFYQPTANRYKIICEAGAFPSDQYALESHVKYHGFDPEDAIIELAPSDGEYILHTENIIEAIEKHQNETALILLGGVNYYTGQLFDMQRITSIARKCKIFIGFDLAHAIGNVSLKLHDWRVDFAVWCSYKYLNSGPGGVGGAFIHEKYADRIDLPRFAGWWGYDETARFEMKKGFKPIFGADGWQLSNAGIVQMAVHKASLDIFMNAGMENLKAKSDKLTGFLEFILKKDNVLNKHLKIITPSFLSERGCQLSLLIDEKGKQIFDIISGEGLICDWREPNVIRLTPVPLYNSFEDVFRAGEILKRAIESVNKNN